MRKSVYNEMSPNDLISREMKQRKLRNADVSRLLDVSPSSVTAMFKRKDMSVNKLIDCCYGFKYNFLQELAGKLEFPGPAIEGETIGSYPKLISNLQLRNSTLEIQNQSLQANLDEANDKLKMLELEHKVVKEVLNKIIEGKR